MNSEQEEADTLRPHGQGQIDLLRELDVGLGDETDAVSVSGLSWPSSGSLTAVILVFFLLGLELAADGRRRVDDDLAVGPVRR